MKLKSIAALTMFLVSSACADPTEDEEKFLKIEGADPSYRVREMETFKKADLPAGIIELMQGYDWGSADGSLPATFQGYRLDLNKDGQKEYFIETIYGGSGGPAFMVLARIRDKWSVILDFQGGFGIVPTSTEWPEIVSTSRGGGGTYAKLHFEFEVGRYRETIRESYVRGTITKKVIPKAAKG
jgi:hypothetical protein